MIMMFHEIRENTLKWKDENSKRNRSLKKNQMVLLSLKKKNKKILTDRYFSIKEPREHFAK